MAFSLLHEISVNQTGKRIPVTAYDHTCGRCALCDPLDNFIHPLVLATQFCTTTHKPTVSATTGAGQIATVVNGQSHSELRVLISDTTVFDCRTLSTVAQTISAVCDGALYVLMCAIVDDVCETLYLYVANALWQPGRAFTRITTAVAINQHCVPWSATTSRYLEVFLSVYAVVVEQSWVDHMPIYRVTTAGIYFTNRTIIGCFFDKYALQSGAIVGRQSHNQQLILNKGDNRNMKNLIKNKWAWVAVAVIVIAAWSMWKPAPAEAAEVGFTLGAERKIDAETNAMYLDTDFGSVLGMDVTTGVNYTVDDDLNASFDNFELDLSKDLSDKATVYANSDFDVNLDHTETVVGFKISF